MFSKGTLHNTVVLSLVPVIIVFLYLIMRTFVDVKSDLHPASHILPMDISELCVNPSSIWPYLDVSGSFSNADLHSLVDIILPPSGIPTVVGGVLTVVCLWGLVGLV